jgi:Holliday junction resolvase RusA-like endonuclease
MFTVDFPLPPREASPNWRGHWRRQREATTAYRETCGWILKSELPGVRFAGVRVSYEFFQASPLLPDNCATFRDSDNALAAMKAAQDSLKDAGVVPDDSYRFVSIGGVVVRPARQSEGKRLVRVTLEETETT